MLSCVFKVLYLEEEADKVIEIWCVIDINIQNCIKSLKTLCKFTHCPVMDWCSAICILLREYLSQPINNVFRVLIKQIKYTDIKLLMSFERISIMEKTKSQLAMFNVHIFESVSVLFN